MLKTESYSGFKYHARDGRESQDEFIVNEVTAYDIYKMKEISQRYPVCNTVIDIGGHIGSFTYMCKKYNPKAKVYAFEPCKASFELYKKNMLENGIMDVQVFNKGVTYDNNCSTVIMKDFSTGISIFLSKEEAEKIVKEKSEHEFDRGTGIFDIACSDIEPITFEEILEQNKIENIDILKVDCEGAEIGILNNMTQESANKIDKIVCEYHLVGGNIRLLEMIGKKFSHLNFLNLHNFKALYMTDKTFGTFVALKK
jgi:FkbM family methyltransferase